MTDIIHIYNSNGSEFFSVSQWRSDLILQSQIINKGIIKKKEIDLEDTFEKGKTKFITILSGNTGTKVYLDGKFAKDFPTLSNNDIPQVGTLLIGNSPTGERHWEGEIYWLAFYNQALNDNEIIKHHSDWVSGHNINPGIAHPAVSYNFKEKTGQVVHNNSGNQNHLFIPSTFKALKRTFFSSPIEDFKLTWNYFIDIAVNLFGFIPFGYFVFGYLYTSKKQYSITGMALLTILIGFGISFAIEFTQAYLPTRSSSLTDLINNTVGTAIGLLLFKFSIPFLASKGLIQTNDQKSVQLK